MKVNEPYCVLLKRKGANHIEQQLVGKSINEELLFWQERTEKLRKNLIGHSDEQLTPHLKNTT
jgi:hypothetical protein